MATRKTGKKSSPSTRRHRAAAPVPPAGTPPPAQPEDSARLQELRRNIDAVDQRLVQLLNERASLVVEVGKAKRADGTPVYAPHREAEVLRKVLASNKGPLSDRALEGVYRELMSGSFALEHPLRIGYLGPPGSNSHAAAVKQFGASVDYEDLREIAGVFTEVRRGHVNYGLVPIENSLGGGIVETLDAFKANAHQISIYGEVQLSVHHALLANCLPRQVRRVHSKPEIFQQCRNWLSTQYPGVELIPAASGSRAAQIAADECRKALEIGSEPGSAAIGSVLAGQLYGLNVLFPRIEDDPSNITRFVIIARQHARPTGDDKTSLMFTTEDKPGALVLVLGVFQSAGINLSHIDKRPQGRERWTYTFFVDAVGHREDPAMAAAIEQAQAHCRELFVLGSYPRSRRIL
ncbi:chorismate mutase [Archangium sp.]|uniref:chorismate mutase n=1 Tax=Archangium sp. TaxID=1872627 RepID=UPI002D725FC5|nr:chorismate mutase [Archangium sp.]HYO59263.1 chorismate mutase [Archangium sp.]